MVEVVKFNNLKDLSRKVNHRFNSIQEMNNWKKAVEVQTKKKMFITYQEKIVK